MRDGFGREIDYIRISVTDRCNLRCRYCMPEEGLPLLAHEEILTFEEMERICGIGAELGIRKVKITGGEPLVRSHITEFVKKIANLPGIEDVTMTSNGCLLKEAATALKEAGLSTVNVSLDTLDGDRFFRLTRRDEFSLAQEGIDSAIKAGLKVKINCAVVEELTPEEVLSFAAYSVKRQLPVRFIEMMPIGQGRAYEAMDNEKLYEILGRQYRDLERTDRVTGNGPAVYYSFDQGRGTIGFISGVHHKFCGSCNRIRLTSNGCLKLCLGEEKGLDLRTPMRGGCSDRELKEMILQAVMEKPECHHFEERKISGEPWGDLNMNQIGG